MDGYEDIMRKYSGHWFLKSDRERTEHAITYVKNTFLIQDDGYTRGYLDACARIKRKFAELCAEADARTEGDEG